MPPDAAVGDDRHAGSFDRKAALHQGLHLRHAKAGGDAPCSLHRPDADLDAVGAAIDQESRALGGGDVAGDDLDVGKFSAELAHRAVHDHRVPVRDVDDEQVDAGADQLACPLEIVARRADCGADHQPALRVAGRKGTAPLTDQVLGGDEPLEHAVVVDERQLLDLALDHHALGLFRRGGAAMDDQPIERRHAIGDRRAGAVDEAQIALGEQSEQPRLASTTTSVPTRDRDISARASDTGTSGPTL